MPKPHKARHLRLMPLEVMLRSTRVFNAVSVPRPARSPRHACIDAAATSRCRGGGGTAHPRGGRRLGDPSAPNRHGRTSRASRTGARERGPSLHPLWDATSQARELRLRHMRISIPRIPCGMRRQLRRHVRANAGNFNPHTPCRMRLQQLWHGPSSSRNILESRDYMRAKSAAATSSPPRFRCEPSSCTMLTPCSHFATQKNGRPRAAVVRRSGAVTPPSSSASAVRSTSRRTPRTSTGSSRCSRCASS